MEAPLCEAGWAGEGGGGGGGGIGAFSHCVAQLSVSYSLWEECTSVVF